MSNHPRNLDDNIQPLRLPEHLRREPLPPSTGYVPNPPREPTFLEKLDASIRHDPLKQIACTVCYLRFKDMVQLAKEISGLTEAPANSDAEVMALKFAVKLHQWAEGKFPPEQETS